MVEQTLSSVVFQQDVLSLGFLRQYLVLVYPHTPPTRLLFAQQISTADVSNEQLFSTVIVHPLLLTPVSPETTNLPAETVPLSSQSRAISDPEIFISPAVIEPGV